MPIGKESLLALASLLMLNYFMKKSNTKNMKVKKGGVMINRHLVSLLAPLGVNTLGASIIILILLYIVRKNKKSKKSKKGGSCGSCESTFPDDPNQIGGNKDKDKDKDTQYLDMLRDKLNNYNEDSFKSIS